MRRSLLAVACLAATAACYPGRAVDSTTQYSSVTTLVDTTADFTTVTRYALTDSVVEVPRNEDLTDDLPLSTEASILASIRSNLNALGWVEVTDARATAVDVYVTASVSTTTNIFLNYFWWDYWYWYGYWPPGWGAGWGYYYPGYWYAYAYTTGTLLVNMIDARPTTPYAGQNRVPVVWTFAVNGVLEGQSTNIAIATAGIDQAFDQSPYLRGGPPQ